ncbi:MAG: hypothetical protein Kow0069_31250 [Promethearchaeota archaeon]
MPVEEPDRATVSEFQRALLEWYARHGRHFAWREPRVGSYATLVAEVLLQRTPAPRADPVVRAVLAQYPRVEALSEADPADLEAFLAPLGLQKRRAKSLRLLATRIREIHGGRVPRSYDALVALPGVGDYVARAVRAFGFSYREPVVDVNVLRVYNRAFGVPVRRPASDPRRNAHAVDLAKRMLPEDRRSAKKFQWALLDLGALACTPASPNCEECPAGPWCRSRGRV